MADFGIFRGFSDKLFQGQLPTNLGKIGAFDVDAQEFINRTTSAGGSLSDSEKSAINLLVLD